MLLVNRRARAVLVSLRKISSNAAINVGKDKKSRAPLLQPGSAARYKRARRRLDVSIECTSIHEAIFTPTLLVSRCTRTVLVS